MTKEALKLALEALEAAKELAGKYDAELEYGFQHAITAIKQALAQPVRQAEPVAWLHPANSTCVTTDPTAYSRGIPLYAAPPQRPWVGLTDDEVSKILDDEIGFNSCWGPEKDFARAIEAKLKEKNT